MSASFITFVSGVNVSKQTIIACAAINAANELGLPVNVFVTSGNDRTHMRGSKHYTDEALDFRTKTMTTKQKHDFKDVLSRRLGPDYQLVLEDEGGENEHLHVEYDPK